MLRAVVFCLLLLSGGCASVESVRVAPGTADRTFRLQEPCDVVSAALRAALLELGFRIDIDDGDDACPKEFVATSPISAFSWGEIVRLRLHQQHGERVLAIHTERRLATNLTARGDWALEIYQVLVMRLLNQPGVSE